MNKGSQKEITMVDKVTVIKMNGKEGLKKLMIANLEGSVSLKIPTLNYCQYHDLKLFLNLVLVFYL